jgi:hypothetical protein
LASWFVAISLNRKPKPALNPIDMSSKGTVIIIIYAYYYLVRFDIF